MSNILKRLVAGLAVVAMTVPVFSGCAKKEEEAKAIVDTIYIGTHYQAEDDPYWVNEITGEPVMNPDRIKAAQAALKTVKEELGVDIKWKQWPNGVTQDILQTVLAGDPYCHIAILSNGFQGRVMVQNVLQPIDEYMHIFTDDPDATWIASGKTFGKHYLFNRDLLYITDWPMVYNATMLEEVPSLKEADGTTLYPVELYERGEWTWSKFEWYLTQVKTYYTGKKADSGKEIVPYDARYQYTAVQAIHSNNAYLYNGEGMAFDTPEAIEACEYLDRLMTNGLVNCVQSKFGTSRDPGYLQSVDCFARGETVFTNCARWRMGTASSILAARGESMGVIPFPYPDGTNPHTDENSSYRHLTPMADSVGLLRGIDEETSRIALEAYKMYKVEFYKAMAGVDSIADYMVEQADDEALAFGVDIFHPEIGDANLDIWIEFGKSAANEYSEACGVMWTWSDILGKSIYGINGFAKYRTAVEANKQEIFKKLETIGEAVNSEGAIDAVKPSISRKEVIALPNGTNPEAVDWSEYLAASDNADGDYEIDEVTIDWSEIDFDAVGTYTDSLKASVTDKGGNTGTASFTVMVYNKENTQAPTLQAKEGIPEINLNTDVSTVNWGSYVEWAKDADGIDISANISADTGWLDVTEVGEYDVDLVATDYVGNTVEATIKVKVK